MKILTGPLPVDTSRIVGTVSSVRRSLCANPAWYCPKFPKQSSAKWFAHTVICFPSVGGILPSKMKFSHADFLWSVGRRCTDLCGSPQPTTKHLFLLLLAIARFQLAMKLRYNNGGHAGSSLHELVGGDFRWGQAWTPPGSTLIGRPLYHVTQVGNC